MFLLSLVVSLLPLLVRPQCQVEPSPENVVTGQHSAGGKLDP